MYQEKFEETHNRYLDGNPGYSYSDFWKLPLKAGTDTVTKMRYTNAKDGLSKVKIHSYHSYKRRTPYWKKWREAIKESKDEIYSQLKSTTEEVKGKNAVAKSEC